VLARTLERDRCKNMEEKEKKVRICGGIRISGRIRR
jgi:hypothetical protein